MANLGIVYLVGAGPGDPGLITLRGVECLQRADVVLYDDPVNASILQHIPRQAELICLGGPGHASIWPQPAINSRLVAEAEAGRTVVRLKCGDPLIFGRASEELQALVNRGIAFEIVPGVTAALAASAYAGIPLTHRDHASAVALVSGQENPEKTEASVDLDALARFPGTIAVYLGVTSASRWARRLLAAGFAANSPVAVVGRCSWPDQQILRCRLDQLAAQISPDSQLPPPAIAIVGPFSWLDQTWAWFQRRPLFGRRVLITRPRHQIAVLERPLRELGADVLVQPAIEITDPDDWSLVDATLHRLQEFDYLVFSSANGVEKLLTRLLDLGYDTRVLSRLRLAAIGPGTASALSSFHLRADVMPSHDYRAEGLLQTLREQASGKRFLLVRASRGRQLLAEGLRAEGATVEQVVAYLSRDVSPADDDVTELLDKRQIDWVTVTSSAIAGSLVQLFGTRLKHTRLVSISPVTSATLRQQGLEPQIEATTYTMEGVVDAILQDASAASSAGRSASL